MDLNQYLAQNTANLSPDEKTALGLDAVAMVPPTTEGGKSYTQEELYGMTDPQTGKHYLIPFLSTGDPEYRKKYIEAMRTKLSDPATFNRMLLGN